MIEPPRVINGSAFCTVIVEHDIQVEPRMGSEKAGQMGDDMQAYERDRRADAQTAGQSRPGVASREVGLVGFLEDAPGRFIIALTRLRHRQAARRARQKFDLEPFLQVAHCPRNGRLSNPELAAWASQSAYPEPVKRVRRHCLRAICGNRSRAGYDRSRQSGIVDADGADRRAPDVRGSARASPAVGARALTPTSAHAKTHDLRCRHPKTFTVSAGVAMSAFCAMRGKADRLLSPHLRR